MSNAPPPDEEPPKRPKASVGNLMLHHCSSCQVVSGGGLMFAGAYIYGIARRSMKPGHLVRAGTFAQLYFGSGLIAWGLVIITMPWLIPPPSKES